MTSTGLYPTTTGVSLGDLGASVVPLARNIAATRLPVLRAPEPVFASWAVTEACNLACAHCDMNRPLRDEPDHPRRLEVARGLARSGVWGVSLIGGEPLLVDGLFEYARLLKDGGKRVFLGTSGDRLARFIDPVLDTVDVVTVSAEGADAASHDAFRRRLGLFDRVVGAVDAIAARRAGALPRLQARLTINRKNFREFGEVIAYWQQHVDNVLVQVVQDNGLHGVRDKSCLFQPDDRAEFERVYAALRAQHPFLSGRYFDLLPRYVFEPEALQRDLGFRCLLVPATSVVVEANGKVKLCHGRPDSELGEIGGGDLRGLWGSERAAEARTRMQSREYGCMCWESSFARNLELVELARYRDAVMEALRGVVAR